MCRDYDNAYRNPFHHSEFDDISVISAVCWHVRGLLHRFRGFAVDCIDMCRRLMLLQRTIASFATVLARSMFALATGDNATAAAARVPASISVRYCEPFSSHPHHLTRGIPRAG
jgi:hypothetical protein